MLGYTICCYRIFRGFCFWKFSAISPPLFYYVLFRVRRWGSIYQWELKDKFKNPKDVTANMSLLSVDQLITLKYCPHRSCGSPVSPLHLWSNQFPVTIDRAISANAAHTHAFLPPHGKHHRLPSHKSRARMATAPCHYTWPNGSFGTALERARPGTVLRGTAC